MQETPSTQFIYLCLSYEDWKIVKKTGSVSLMDSVDENTMNWFKDQVYKRRPSIQNISENLIYGYLTKQDVSYKPAKHAICKVRVSEDSIIQFDDNLYVNVINNFMNEDHIPLTFCSWNEKEAEQTSEADRETCMSSYERMFDFNSIERDKSWTGKPELRVFIAGGITRQMIRKVWIYRNNTRLRKKK